MRRILLSLVMLFVLCPSAQASIEATYAQWERLRDPAQPEVSFHEAYGFLRDHPNWPHSNLIRMRTEQAALLERPDAATMQSFCAQFPPISGRGMIACMQATAGDRAQRQHWLTQAWQQGDFTESEERDIVSAYGDAFSAKAHQRRAERLLMENKLTGVARMLPRLSPNYRLLYEAGIALMSNARNATAKLHNVPSALRAAPALTLARITWRARNGQENGVPELFAAAPGPLPHADLWWPQRAAAVRTAINHQRYDTALTLLANVGQLKNSEFNADALFLRGWISMEYAGDARSAYKDFYALYDAVSTPVSKARAAYWAGRAAQKNGNGDIARDWFEKGADFPTVFYGQLAQAQLSSIHRLDLPSSPSVSESAIAALDNAELPRAIRLLNERRDMEMLSIFLAQAADTTDDEDDAATLAAYAAKHTGRYGGVKVAKQVLRRNIVLIERGWPTLNPPDNLAIEPALAMAITRQESEFNPRARSNADARGLMQILPGTANHIARKAGLPYSAANLYEPVANVTMGTEYLGSVIAGFDGSYILGIASYNAGPGNVRKWVAANGWPPRDAEGAINWIEKIPFAETRNYVQRVLENVQVYRTRLHGDAPLSIAADLVR